jgi:hypothetical protein
MMDGERDVWYFVTVYVHRRTRGLIVACMLRVGLVFRTIAISVYGNEKGPSL